MAKIKVTIEMGSELITTHVDEGSTIRALVSNGSLRGIAEASTRVNGTPAELDVPLQEGDTVSQVSKSGKQG